MFIWRINKENPEFVLQINNFMYQKKKYCPIYTFTWKESKLILFICEWLLD